MSVSVHRLSHAAWNRVKTRHLSSVAHSVTLSVNSQQERLYQVGDLKLIFGSTVKSRRTELGISQEELADRAGLHRTYISDVERGARNPSLGSIEKLARALGSSVPSLFERALDEDISARAVEILLVEDNARNAELTRRAFRNARITNPVRVVRDGTEALDFLFATGSHAARRNEPPPGVIVLDLNLPKIGGLEILRRIKADKRTRGIPVVVLTVSARSREMNECRRLGAASCVVKPVGFQKFTEAASHLEMEWALVKAITQAGSQDHGH